MADIKETLKEAKAVITALKTQADLGTAWTGTSKADIEARIAHLNNKASDHSKSPKKLDIDLTELDNLDTIIGQDKAAWAIEKAKIEKAKTDAEQATTDKNGELVKAVEDLDKYKKEVGDKLTAELVKKLEKVADSTPADQTQKLTDIKTTIDEIKTKGAKADLTDIISKVDALSSKADEIKTQTGKDGPGGGDNVTKYSAISAAISAGLALAISVYGTFFKPSNGQTIIKNNDNE